MIRRRSSIRNAGARAALLNSSTRRLTNPASATIRVELRRDGTPRHIRGHGTMADIVQKGEEARRPAIARLLDPRSVAIAGISAAPASLGATVLDDLARFGFSGKVHLIHPTRAELRGIRCVQTTADLPDGVDCVVLAIPAAAVLEAVKGCAARGVGGVIIFSAGFAEVGPKGRAVQDAIAAVARESGM